MKKLYIILTIIFSTIALYATAQNGWIQQSNFPGAARFYDAGFSIGNYGFIGCGENSSLSTFYNDFYKWNQTTNQWSAISNYPGVGSISPISASIEGNGYVGLGASSTSVATDLWSYDTTSNLWTAMASLPGLGRYDASFFTIGHKIYVIGGSTGGPPYLNDAWVYDAHKNTWTQLSDPPSAGVDNMVAFSIGNHGYIGGGWNGSNAQSAFWEYDTTSDTWTSITPAPVAVWGDPRTFVIGTKAYVCNGLDVNSNPLSNGYAYDTVTKTWSIFTNMNVNGIECSHAAAFSIGDYGYIGTGKDSVGNLLADLWQYGPDTSTPCDNWTAEAAFPSSARFYDAGFSIGNYGFIGCGENSSISTFYNDFYKWNQTTNQWSAISNYPGVGSISPISASIEGNGYVGLGTSSTSVVATDLWSYDTTSNLWTAMASLPGLGRYDASFFTIGHKIYVIGGSTGGPPYLNDAWVYDAHKNTWTQLSDPPSAGIDNMVAFSIGNHGYIGGGWNGSNAQSAFWEYDTTSDTWTSITPAPVAVWGDPRTFVIGTKAYVCNGLDVNSNPLSNGYAYDTVTKTWSIFTNMNVNGIECSHAAAFSIGDYGYIGTGEGSTGNFLNDFWQLSLCTTGINEIGSNPAQLKLYPNPNDGTFNLSYNGLENQQSELRIIDILGRVLKSYNIIGSSGQLAINDNSLVNGLYFYQVISSQKIIYDGKFIINR